MIAFANLSCTINNIQTKQGKIVKHGRFWLNTSLYSGQFFDDEGYRLVSYQPFKSINFVGIDNQKLKSPKEEIIIPKGTLVDIISVNYPSNKSDLLRPLYSPRNDVWVVLKVARERGNVNIFYEKNHIFLVPNNIINIDKILEEIFVKEDPNPWLLTQRKHFQEAIFKKKPLVGMDEKHVFSALGIPEKKQKLINGFEEEEVWEYPDYTIFFTKGLVTKIVAKTLKGI